MGRVSQRHRLEVTGLDSSGRPPAPGSVYIAPTQALAIVTATGTDTKPGAISVTGLGFTALQTLNVSLTPGGGAQANLSVAAVAGDAEVNAQALATLISGQAEFTAVAIGARVEVLSVLPTATFTIDSVSIT